LAKFLCAKSFGSFVVQFDEVGVLFYFVYIETVGGVWMSGSARMGTHGAVVLQATVIEQRTELSLNNVSVCSVWEKERLCSCLLFVELFSFVMY